MEKAHNSITILLLEDDVSISEVTQLILENDGYEVIAVSDGREVKNRVNKSLPDLILMDIWAPEHDVRKITRYLKKQPITQHIPIILFSATSNIDKIVAEAGADDFIPKPFDIDELLAMVHKYTSTKKAP